jgi:site-specific DNA recombinase
MSLRLAAPAEPIRGEARARMLYSIARARSWVEGLTTGEVISFEQIAAIEGCSARSVRMTISLAFLSPDIITAAIEGTLPHGSGVSTLFDPGLFGDDGSVEYCAVFSR